MSRNRVLHVEQFIPRPLEEVFAFFSDAGNLERITPPWLRFSIQSAQPVEMRVGTLIDYKLRVHGLPLRWRSRISAWAPPRRFVDEQVRGPYRVWIHEHRFEEVPGGVRVTDHVEYRAPGGPLEPVIHALLVRPDVQRIFAYRRRALAEIFGAGPAAESAPADGVAGGRRGTATGSAA
ncbi:MAG: SRPBCC family protein [Phycisphaerales bacterium JB039]